MLVVCFAVRDNQYDEKSDSISMLYSSLSHYGLSKGEPGYD